MITERNVKLSKDGRVVPPVMVKAMTAEERAELTTKKIFVVLLVMTKKDGTKERYRRDATIQTLKGAKDEEVSLVRRFFEADTFKPVVAAPKVVLKVNTFKEALDYYKKHGLTYLKESSRRGFLHLYNSKRFERWMGWDVTKITSAAIAEWQRELVEGGHLNGKVATFSKSNMAMHRAALLAVLRDVGPDADGNPGVMLTMLPTLPSLPKNLRRDAAIEAPTDEQVTRILEESTPQIRLAFALGAYAGLRAGEIRALSRGQINLEERKLTIDRSKSYGVTASTKSGRERVLPIDRRLVPLLKERLDQMRPEEDTVCVTSQTGEPWGQFGLLMAMRRLKEKLGVKTLRVHGLRHYRGTKLAAVTDIKTVQKTLGHAHVTTTMRYVTVEFERMREAADLAAE